MTRPGGDDQRPAPHPAHRALRAAVVGLLLVAFVAFVDIGEVAYDLSLLPTSAVLLAVLLLTLDRFMMGLKWRQLVLGAGARMRLLDAVAIYYQSKFATLVFPAVFGGEVLRGVLGARAGVPSHVLLASMVVERVVAALSSLILAGVGLWYLGTLPSYDQYGATAGLLVLAAGATLGAMALVALHRPSHKLAGRVVRRWVPERVFRVLERLSDTALRYKQLPGVLSVNLALTLVEHLLQMLALYVMARGLGVSFTLMHFIAMTSIIMLVRRGAGFLEGWGIAESGVVMLYTLFGVSASRSAALALALWAVSLLACLPGGYLLWRGAWRIRGRQADSRLPERSVGAKKRL
jgi:uncharacterized protein (TIRG00374 family)